jgi:hypothetical protein
MTIDTMLGEIIEQDGVLAGPFRRPRNTAAGRAGQHPRRCDGEGPRLPWWHRRRVDPHGAISACTCARFGERWFETGSLSTYFRNATTDGEPVRAFVRTPAADAVDAQVDVWMEDEHGTQVLEGTASIDAPAEPSRLRAEPRAAGELRMFSHLRARAAAGPVPTRLKPEVASSRQRVLTEPLPWYEGASPWGGPIANPGLVVHIMRPVEAALGLFSGRAVGLFGAIEVRHVNGPVFVDRDYEASGTILAVGDTPKSEYVWYESALREPGGARDVASMIMMMRLMKASSPLWRDG